MKTCIICKQSFNESFFYNDKSKPDGKKPRCKICEKLYIDKTKRLKYEKEYWLKRKSERRQIRKRCYQKNKEKYSETRKLRYGTFGFILVQKKASLNRRALKKVNKEYIKMLMNKKTCHYCGCVLNNKIEIDHVIPISKGGNNDDSNLVASCMKCNRIKGKKTVEEFKQYLNDVQGVGY